MCNFKQIYKNVPGIGFFVKAGRRFAKRMEPHKFVDTNLLINLDLLKMENAFASRMVTVGSRSNGYSHTAKILTVKILYFVTNWWKFAIVIEGMLNFIVKSCKTMNFEIITQI